VLTKADKISLPALDKVKAATAEGIRRRAAAFPDIIATSSEKGLGIEDLQEAILKTVAG
jgi:GTP-binding protein